MAEAFLKVVLDNLSSLIREEIGLIMGVDREMKKLCSVLTTIQAVLEDAEDKQIENKPIRDWLRKLNCLAYEIDDILDVCATHVSKLKYADSKRRRYTLKKILYRHKIARRVKQVTGKLDDVSAERAKFHLRELPVDKPRELAAARETGSLLNDSDHIFGRDEDKEKIVKMLVDDVRDKQEMSVLPIIGVGGLGKTTLARLVFNDPRVVEHFEKRVWVCVSDNFDTKTLVKAMIESATGSAKASELQHLDALERCLWGLLSQQRYLLVLDDVWNDHQKKWIELRDILSCGSAGASIIVTTRQRKVAEIMGTLPAHCLKGLSDYHCWMLLRQSAFGQQEGVHPKLEVIGKQIVKRCAGVPLAAQTLGGILRFKRTEDEWIYVKESDLWNLPQENTLIMPALRLSYHHLPLELRQCFAYFAAFPKDDYEIEKEELIKLWMAHGYISSTGTLQVEDVGNEICNELVLRSLFQQTSSFYISVHHQSISMHDLVHDLAQSVMENKVPGLQVEKNVTIASTIRQVNLVEKYMMFPKSFQHNMDISSVMELTSLRVLDAKDVGIKDLPCAIGNLKHLRYLNLSMCEIRTLPNSLCSLWNLQILNLNHCYDLVALPKNMRYLHNLQHLCLTNCLSLSEMPSNIRELSGLKTLSMFVVGHNRGNQLEELECLELRGRLEIRHLERVKDHMDATKSNIGKKKNIWELILRWERNSLSRMGENVYEDVLEALQPHPNLESLTISGFGGRYFPLWMANSILGKVIEIVIQNCQNCTLLPKLGELAHLKKLVLRNLAVAYIIEDEVENEKTDKIPFLALEILHLFNLPNMKGLSKEQKSKEAFPNLKVLWIERSSSLILPPLSSLQKLEDLQCSSSSLALFSEHNTITTLRLIIDERMTCFPVEMVAKFSILRSLTISHAKEISVRGGVQALKKLNHLVIEYCETMGCFPQGMLQHLTALKSLDILECPQFVELPDEIKDLKNLKHLQLFSLPKIECLPKALQHLSSLKRLFLTSLPQVDSLPDWLDKLTHLQSLHLQDCKKVVSFPAAIQRLQNLKELVVVGCPELERRCERETGDDWHKIAHIPRLRIGRY